MQHRTLSEWLDYQQCIHPRSVELGLDRVRVVWQRMDSPHPAPVVIAVGGTNGKGSTVAFLEAILVAAHKRVGCYTSPHLLRYNERVRVLGVDADDAALVDAFERIETARREIPLTYFEFGTLAALWIFSQSKLDVAMLEVGLGGRLDAVNIVDADAAIVTTVDLDHQDWLGNDRDSIGREKAGIFRAGRPAIIGMREPPDGLLVEAERIGARLVRAGRDFDCLPQIDAWRWTSISMGMDPYALVQEEPLMLPEPALAAPCQIDNVAAAIAALYSLRDRLGWYPQSLAEGVRTARAAARLQRLHKSGCAELVIDVAHNPQAAGVLAQWLGQHPPQARNLAVFGALADKDVGGIVASLVPRIAAWFLGGLDVETPRGVPASELHARMLGATLAATVAEHANIAAALDCAAAAATAADRILAFGSFFVAAAALEWANRNGYCDASA